MIQCSHSRDRSFQGASSEFTCQISASPQRAPEGRDRCGGSWEERSGVWEALGMWLCGDCCGRSWRGASGGPRGHGRLSIPSCDLTTPQGQAIVFTAWLLLTASRNMDSTSPPISGCTLPVGNCAQCCGDAEAEGGEPVRRPYVEGKGWGGKFLFTWFLISIFRITQ